LGEDDIPSITNSLSKAIAMAELILLLVVLMLLVLFLFSQETHNKTEGRPDVWQENSGARYEQKRGKQKWREHCQYL
jgi:hypothetical protein